MTIDSIVTSSSSQGNRMPGNVRENCAVANVTFHSVLVFSSMHVYYTVIYDVGGGNLGRIATESEKYQGRRNVREFHSAWRLLTPSSSTVVIVCCMPVSHR